MSRCSLSSAARRRPPPSHNLDIRTYSLEDLLGLFQLSVHRQITIDDLKRAKMQVLSMHPDKSNLHPEYFIFYKKALEVIVNYSDDQTRVSKTVPSHEIQYSSLDSSHQTEEEREMLKNRIQKQQRSDGGKFQQQFNKVFEENMAYKPDTTRNAWFHQETPVFSDIQPVSSSKNMVDAFDQIKKQNAAMVKYNGVQTLRAGGSSYYDDEDEIYKDEYISCDPFSKLKYDDLRKVHKDQTVFSVSESDFHNVQQYKSVDQYMRSRDQHNYDPMANDRAQEFFLEQERMMKEQALRKQHAAEMQRKQYEEKNRKVMTTFLQLGN